MFRWCRCWRSNQETYGYLCTHYAISRLMHEVALAADLDPDRLSFTRSLRAVRRSTRAHPGFPHRLDGAHRGDARGLRRLEDASERR